MYGVYAFLRTAYNVYKKERMLLCVILFQVTQDLALLLGGI